MGIRNFLVEGVSGTGKSSVCKELQRRGYSAINGDNELAYQGDPEAGEPTDRRTHEHHIWHVGKVQAIVADQGEAVALFCVGSRNFTKFIDLFDGVFILEVDLGTLNRRLDERTENEWGGRQTEREFIARLHQTKEDIPKDGITIDATAPIARVVDEIVRQSEAIR
jgi:gluconate kinase